MNKYYSLLLCSILAINVVGQKSNTDFPSIINELTETKTAPSKKTNQNK